MNRIEKGDKVIVRFNGAQYTLIRYGTVLLAPSQAGEGWIVRDEETGDIHDITEGCTVTKTHE